MPSRLYKILLILGLFMAVLLIPAFWLAYPVLSDFFSQNQAEEANQLEISFLDVGQGDATLIQTPNGINILIDGGPDDSIINRLNGELPFWERTIDLMILSHPHDDHVYGLIPVINRYQVKKILYSGVTHTNPSYFEWLELINEKEIPLSIIDRPQTIELEQDIRLEILWPRESLAGKEVGELNNSSIILKLVHGETSFLLTGDAEKEVEEELVRLASSTESLSLQANVLKAGHHGSDTSSSEEFLSLVQPEIVVIPVGEDNKFGHPSRRVLKRFERIGARVYRNDLDGTVRLVSDGENVIIKNPKH